MHASCDVKLLWYWNPQERTVKGVVMQMGAHEVYDVVSNMKQLVEKEPDKAKQMFVSHPQVRKALVGHPS